MCANFNKKQIEALTTLDKNVIVSAGAGSGKTAVLSNRFLNILKSYNKDGINADNILAITFTIKAANEMKERVRQNMLRRLRVAGHVLASKYTSRNWKEKAQPEFELWNEQLKKLELAQVSTIDSLCSRILKENPLAAGIAPNCQMIEEYDNNVFYEECVYRFIRARIAEKMQDGTPNPCFNADLKLLFETYDMYSFQSQLKTLVKNKDNILELNRNLTPEEEKTHIQELVAKYDYDDAVFEPVAKAIETYQANFDKEYQNREAAEQKVASDVKAAESSVQTLTTSIDNITKLIDGNKQAIDETKQKLKDAKAELKVIKKSKIPEKIAAQEKIIENFNTAIEELKGKNEQLKLEQDSQKAKKKEASKQVTAIKNVYKGVGAVLDVFKGIFGAVKEAVSDFTNSVEGFNNCQEKLEKLKKNCNKDCLKPFKNEIDTLSKTMQDVQPYFYNKQAQELVPVWYRLLKEFCSYFAEEKNTHNILTFEDLEKKTLELLRNNVAVRRKYQKMFMFIMVDEFQDTNELQKQLIYLLYGDNVHKLEKPCSDEVEKEEYKLKNLFVVGDPKQSIYRFRGADVTVFHAVQKDILNADVGNSGIRVPMNLNYRSQKAVLEACNEFFPKLMGENKDNPVYYEKLIYGQKKEKQDEAVELLYIDRAKGEDDREREAEALAKRIKELVAQGYSYSKITILLRAMKHGDALIECFSREGIPYVVSSGKGFYQCPEVNDLLMLVRSITNRAAIKELVGVLRSPYFGFDEKLITELALKGKLWSMLEGVESIDNEKVKNAAEKLLKLRTYAQTLGIIEFWKKLWEELGVEQVLLGMHGGAVKLANAEKLRKKAIDYCSEPEGTLDSWIERMLDMQDDDTADEKCAVVAAEDAVNLMTIHGSKGLQFDVVFLPALDTDHRDGNNNIAYSELEGIGLKVPDENGNLAKTVVFNLANETNAKLEDEERIRVLYVAMTRAKKKLILSGVVKEDEESADQVFDDSDSTRALSWIKQFKLAAEDEAQQMKHYESWVLSEWQNGHEERMTRHLQERENQFCEADKGDNQMPVTEQSEALVNYGYTDVNTFTPSALQLYANCPRSYYYQYVLGIPGEGKSDGTELELYKNSEDDESTQPIISANIGYRGELDAPTYGHILHRALELYSNEGCQREKLKEYFDVAVNEFTEAENLGEAFEQLEKYVDSDIYKLTGDNVAKVYNELNFAYYLDGKYKVVGVIDCIYFDKDGNMYIVDYKTGHYHDENVGYGIQLAIYSEVAENMFAMHGAKVKSASLHYIPDLKEWNLQKDGKQDYLKLAKEWLQKISNSKNANDFCANSPKGCYLCNYKFMCAQCFEKVPHTEEKK